MGVGANTDGHAVETTGVGVVTDGGSAVSRRPGVRSDRRRVATCGITARTECRSVGTHGIRLSADGGGAVRDAGPVGGGVVAAGQVFRIGGNRPVRVFRVRRARDFADGLSLGGRGNRKRS